MPLASLEKLIAVIAPHRCLSCGATGALLCRVCLDGLVEARRPACFACNGFSPSGRTCSRCKRTYAIDGVTVGAYYDELMRRFVAAIKYERAGSEARLAAELLVPGLYADEFDVVTWVPAVPRRERQRGYNQAKIIAKAVAKQLDLPDRQLLLRMRGNSQVGQSRRTRLEQVKGQFLPARPKPIRDSRVLLVDDVLTTGATMSECSKALKQAGAKSVWGAAVAKH